ncbi:DinB family protein [Spirosoma koreense]
MASSDQPVTDTNTALRKQLVSLLTSRSAHQSFDRAIKDLPADLRGIRPDKVPYSIWQLVDHIRIVQWDILEFSRDPSHESPSWPAEYWPTEPAPADEATWEQALEQIRTDRETFAALLTDPEQDLFTPFAHGDGQTLLREALLIADHTAYHVGEIILIRRLLGAWKS